MIVDKYSRLRRNLVIVGATIAFALVVEAFFLGWEEAINQAIVVSGLSLAAGSVWLSRLTGASGFYWQATAFVWVTVNRAFLVFHVPYFQDHTAQFALPFYLFFGIGLVLTISAMLRVFPRE
jgi:hypothetical protein